MAARRKETRPPPAQPESELGRDTPDLAAPLSHPHVLRKRTQARELVLRALYLVDIRGPEARSEVPAFLAAEAGDPDVLHFAQNLSQGCIERRDELDAKIAQVAENWQIRRMAVIDRNILRLGTYELTAMTDVPPKVTINEAIDLAKKYSTADSGAFVNGILDKLRMQLRPD